VRPFVFNDPGSGQQDFKLLDVAFNEGLLILGGFQFGIIQQFAAFHGLVQARGNLLPLLGTKIVQFILKFLVTLTGQERCGHGASLVLCTLAEINWRLIPRSLNRKGSIPTDHFS
jgi:hypothetical protein